MRLQIGNTEQNNNPKEIKEFSNWILKIGDGTLGDSSNGIVENIYPSVASNFRSEKYFENRAILAPTLRDVESINEHLLSLIPGKMKEYLSSDSVCQSESRSGGLGELYSIDYLNSMVSDVTAPVLQILTQIGIIVLCHYN
ncbi:hypothetical protein ACS0TY_015373 [Phlomoides rotata]